MSLKPKKKSEQEKIIQKIKAKERKMDIMNVLPPYTMIVSEGTKTEPYYLNGFVGKINDKYKKITSEKRIEVYGTGRNTQGLIRFIDQKRSDGEWKRYKKFWLVYDKDDFPYDNFDNTQFEAESRKDIEMSVAWSNESVELWFLLHFQDYVPNNGRKQYIEILERYFDYTKVREDLYDELTRRGSLELAKKRAARAYKEFMQAGAAPSAMVPATRMFELIEELEKYRAD